MRGERWVGSDQWERESWSWGDKEGWDAPEPERSRSRTGASGGRESVATGISLPLILIKLPTPERRHGSKNDSVTFKNIKLSWVCNYTLRDCWPGTQTLACVHPCQDVRTQWSRRLPSLHSQLSPTPTSAPDFNCQHFELRSHLASPSTQLRCPRSRLSRCPIQERTLHTNMSSVPGLSFLSFSLHTITIPEWKRVTKNTQLLLPVPLPFHARGRREVDSSLSSANTTLVSHTSCQRRSSCHSWRWYQI